LEEIETTITGPGQMHEYKEIINQPTRMDLLLLQHLPTAKHESKRSMIGVSKF
jgi:hypothetical protein